MVKGFLKTLQDLPSQAGQYFTFGSLATLGGSTVGIKILWYVLKSLSSMFASNLVPLVSSFLLVYFLAYELKPRDQTWAVIFVVSLFNSLLLYLTVLGLGTALSS